MIQIALAVALGAAQPGPAAETRVHSLGEAAYAIQAGRLDQARLMIGNALKAGAKGPEVDRLLADLAYASGNYDRALASYMQLLVTNSNDGAMHERAGVAAMKTGRVDEGARLLEKATRSGVASWRGWNARGVAADYRTDWAAADESYARALALAPDRAEVLNNSGWSLLARGRWSEALQRFERAAELNPKSQRIAANLELAKAAMSEDLPQRRAGETEAEWATRLNDAGVIARVQGNTKKAVAAFTRALEARSDFYDRAANNLAMAQAAR
jgi:Tfp pilus assembly protein PilF